MRCSGSRLPFRCGSKRLTSPHRQETKLRFRSPLDVRVSSLRVMPPASPMAGHSVAKAAESTLIVRAAAPDLFLKEFYRDTMAITDFRCTMHFRVPFCDIDMLQHVNNAAYVVWAETIRCNYFDEVLGESLVGSCGIILARTEFDYLHPLEYREEVSVGCRIARMGRKSFDFLYEVWSETRQSMAARGRTVMVAYNHEANTSIAIPEKWREVISNYEAIAPETV